VPASPELRWSIALWAVAAGICAVIAWRSRRRRVEPISRNLPVAAAATLAALFVLGVQAARMMIFQQGTFADRSGVDPRTGEVLANARLTSAGIHDMRGSIRDSAGSEIAWSEDRSSYVQRRYVDVEVAHVAGFFSPLLYGAEGIELAADEALSRGMPRGVRDQILAALDLDTAGRENVELTIRSALQREAQELLGTMTGAAVVMEVSTGAVVALASNPVVDPSRLAAVTPEGIADAREYWTRLQEDDRNPLVRRSTLGRYTPGSIFKVVTAAAAIDSGVATPGTVYRDDGVLTVDGHTIVEANRPDDSIVDWTLTEGLAYSLNVVFAQVGLDLGAGRLTSYAEAFGFGSDIPFEFPVAQSQVASSDGFLAEPAALADTAFGQGELLVTPVHMAMLAGCIANRGELMRPFTIRRYLAQDGTTLETVKPEVWRRPVSPATAEAVAEMMVVAVESGYSGGAFVPGVRIGGKTGTAEVGELAPHGWFIGFGGEPDATYAVAVVLEHGGSGAAAPSTIGGSLLRAALSGD
jgi:peptidoglycan glycosyltransferase